ncbi:MAG: MBL fold metallo-hydrolase [Verrucomicrobiota bacterium]|nr:MBL fold metallo-hydrolase [Verrucomicrobiota bacterium]
MRPIEPVEAQTITVRFWGVRGSIASPEPENLRYGGNTSCVEVRAGDQIFILDAGSGIRRLGRALAQEFGARPVHATLLISHTHWDHIQGIPFFQTAYFAANTIRILGAAGMAPTLRTAFKNQMDPIHFPVPLSRLVGLEPVDELPEEPTEVGGVGVRTVALNHPGGCTGFRLSANGVSVAYLPDHEPYASVALDRGTKGDNEKHAKLVEFLRHSDVLILDSQYTREEYPARAGWGHGCLDDSVHLAIDAQVGELVLFHHDPEHDDATIDQMVVRARRLISESGARLTVRAAVERERIVLRDRKQLAA